MVAVTEKLFLPHYFDNGLIGAQADQECLKEIIKNKLPDLYEHLESIDIDLTSITLNWFLAYVIKLDFVSNKNLSNFLKFYLRIFIDAVPFEVRKI